MPDVTPTPQVGPVGGASATFTTIPSTPVTAETAPFDPLTPPEHTKKLQDTYNQLQHDSFNKYYADKIRSQYPNIKAFSELSDQNVLDSTHEGLFPDLTPESFRGALHDAWGKDYQEPPKPSWVKQGTAAVQDWIKGQLNVASAFPLGLTEAAHGVATGGIKIPQVTAQTPEGATELASARHHMQEGGPFALAMLLTGGVEAAASPVINSMISEIAAGAGPATVMAGRMLGAGVKGIAGFGTFGGTQSAAEEAQKPGATVGSVASAGLKGSEETAPWGATMAAFPPAAAASKGLWKALKAAFEAKTPALAKAAVAKFGNAFEGSWAPIDADPLKWSTDKVSEIHGSDVAESEAGQRAIRVMVKKINVYRDDLVRGLKKAPVTPGGEVSQGDTSDWVSPEEMANRKQKMTADGPLWIYATDMGNNNLEAHNVIAQTLEEATKIAQSDSEKFGGKLIGDVTPEYEKYTPPSERRVSTGESPTGVERRQGVMDQETTDKLVGMKNDAISELKTLEAASGDDLKKMFAEKYPDKEVPVDVEAIRDDFKGEAQAKLSGARALLGRSIGPENEVTPTGVKVETLPDGTKMTVKYARKPGESDADFEDRVSGTSTTPIGPSLPRDLAGAKPRYRDFKLQFISDVDKALYIIAQTTKSARDADYRAFLEKSGYAPNEIDALAQKVKNQIKVTASSIGEPISDTLTIQPVAEAQQTASRTSRQAIRDMISKPEEPVKSRSLVISDARTDVPTVSSTTPSPTPTPTPTPTPVEVKAETPVGPVEPTTRAQQTANPEAADIIRRIEHDPMYKQTISDLGGGRRVSHDATLRKAANMPMMTVDELAGWEGSSETTTGKPVNEVTVVRANILRAKLIDDYQQARFEGRPEEAQQAYSDILKVEPGYNNLTGTPGRATEIQSMYKTSETVANKINELKELNTPYQQAAPELDKVLAKAKKEAGIKGLQVPTWFRKIENYSVWAKLSSPILVPLKGLADGVAYMTRASQQIIAAGILKFGGNDAEAAAHFKYAFGTMQGFRDGLSKFLDSYKAMPPEYSILDRPMTAGEKSRVSKWPAPFRALNPLRGLQAVTNLAGAISQDADLSTMAYAQAAREGLTDDAFAARYAELKAKPPKEWIKQNEAVGKYYSGQEEPDRLLKWMQAGQNFPTGRFWFPVIKFPYNLTRQGVRLSPLNMMPGTQAWRDIEAGGVKQAETLGRWATGFGLSMGALALFHSGDVNGAIPKDPKERELWKQEERVPWSFQWNGHSVKFDKTGPLGFFLQQIGAIHEATRDSKFDKASNLATKLVYQYGHGALNVPFLKDMNSLFDVLNNPDRSFDSFKQLTVTGFIPSFLRDIRNQMDPTVRKPTSIKEAVENMIPGMSQNVPSSIKPLGQESQLETSHLLRFTKQTTPFTQSDKTKLMRDIGWAPPLSSPKFTDYKGDSFELTQKDQHQYMLDMGMAVNAAMNAVMTNDKFNDPQYAKYRKKILATVTSALQTGGKNVYKELSGAYDQPLVDKGQKIDRKQAEATLQVWRNALLKFKEPDEQISQLQKGDE